jgi:hypothetical protein
MLGLTASPLGDLSIYAALRELEASPFLGDSMAVRGDAE